MRLFPQQHPSLIEIEFEASFSSKGEETEEAVSRERMERLIMGGIDMLLDGSLDRLGFHSSTSSHSNEPVVDNR